MWMGRRFETHVIVTNTHRLDSVLDSFVFTTWYTQPGVLELRFWFIDCGAYWTNWWAWPAAESIRGEMEVDDGIMVLEREAPQADLDTSNGFEVCAVTLHEQPADML